MVTQQQAAQIKAAADKRQAAYAKALSEQTALIAAQSSNHTMQYLASKKITEYTKSVPQGVTKKITGRYAKDAKKGGSECIERVVEKVGSDRYKVTTRRTFVPWLSDMTQRDTDAILKLVVDGEKAGQYPGFREAKTGKYVEGSIAEDLNTYFEGTLHQAATAARTEAQMIRTDARMDTYVDVGVRYVKYTSAGDELVRPEHAMRDGKIYKIQDAPELGEYNCRCILTDADFLVEEKGAKVTGSQVEYLTAEQAGIV